MPKLKCRPHEPALPLPPPRLSLSVLDAATCTGLSKSYLYTAMAAGRLNYLKAGARRLITIQALETFLAALSMEE